MLIPFEIGLSIQIGEKADKRCIVKISLIPPSIQIICMHKCKNSFRFCCRYIATTQLPALLRL